ncbi:hypothetical protein [Stetteria hydrogenophila]
MESGGAAMSSLSSAERILTLPPRIKVLEAAGAIADGRVVITRRRNGLVVARVLSSEPPPGEKRREYKVIILRANREVFRVYSDDNGTRWRSYVGYPIIAVLMLEGVLPRRPDIEEALKGLKWRELNEKYKRYAIVERIALSRAESKGIPSSEVNEFVSDVMSRLSGLRVIYDPALPRKLVMWM